MTSQNPRSLGILDNERALPLGAIASTPPLGGMLHPDTFECGHRPPRREQIATDPACAIDTAAGDEAGLDLAAEFLVAAGSGAGKRFSMETRPRYPSASHSYGHRPDRPVRRDETKLHFAFAK